MGTLNSRPLYSRVKRVFDVCGAATLLFGCAPFLILVAVCIWLDDGRPIFYTQTRAGHHGDLFRIIKLRTLSTGPKDPARPSDYTTRTGSFLRRWRIDELPQLWNVLRGEMSIIGPRPPLPEDAECYSPRQRLRLEVRPGLTGLAQVNGNNALPWSERINLDIWYVRNRCLRLDLQILLRTPYVLIEGTGVDGSSGRNDPFSSSHSNSHA